jgi:hypothetical protein
MLLCAFGCEDGKKNPAEPGNGQSDYSGAFMVDYTLMVSTCTGPMPPLDDDVSIVVEDDSIWFGSIPGGWAEEGTRGMGTSEQTCVPIVPPDCNGCFTRTFDLTYSSPDTFQGTFDIDFTYTAACGSSDCTTRYSIIGTRIQQ